MVAKDFNGTVNLPYRVTDGKMFSNPATVTLYVGGNANQSSGLGSKRISGRTLAGLPRKGIAKLSYDDNFPGGGAFKVINSWGTDWGENGYFWLHYGFLNTPVEINGKLEGSLLAGLFVLLDDKNSDWVEPTNNIPLQSTNSPNLAIMSWTANYEPKPFGKGELWYRIANTRIKSAVQAMIKVSLILSKQPDVTVNNYYNDEYYPIVQEDLNIGIVHPNEEVGHTSYKSLPFQFPSFPPGTYYLHLMISRFDAANILLNSSLIPYIFFEVLCCSLKDSASIMRRLSLTTLSTFPILFSPWVWTSFLSYFTFLLVLT
jgi:Papain family cysteine protease